jgi:haloacetate dehalogenase
MAMEIPPVTHHFARINGVRLHYVKAGPEASAERPPLYLLHGYPQSWYLWRKTLAPLAERFPLVVPDLRGYGDSDKPASGYDKRTLAADIRELARHLGHSRLALAGHDRGARVAHRYALDHGETLTGVAMLDIVPTRTVFERADRGVATGTWHWFFFQVADLPEILFHADPEACLRYFFRNWAGNPDAIEEEAIQEYLRTFRIPGTIRATLEDYRMGATTDLEQDRADEHQRIEVPLLALWGGMGRLDSAFDVLACWREKARNVTGRGIATSGHFIPEEGPEELTRELISFFGPLH